MAKGRISLILASVFIIILIVFNPIRPSRSIHTIDWFTTSIETNDRTTVANAAGSDNAVDTFEPNVAGSKVADGNDDQAGVANVLDDTTNRLGNPNRNYLSKHGGPFISYMVILREDHIGSDEFNIVAKSSEFQFPNLSLNGYVSNSTTDFNYSKVDKLTTNSNYIDLHVIPSTVPAPKRTGKTMLASSKTTAMNLFLRDKVMNMLLHQCRNPPDVKYEWFVVMDTDTYILHDKLSNYLKNVDSKDAMYNGRCIHAEGSALATFGDSKKTQIKDGLAYTPKMFASLPKGMIGGGSGIVLSRHLLWGRKISLCMAIEDVSHPCRTWISHFPIERHYHVGGGDWWLGRCVRTLGVNYGGKKNRLCATNSKMFFRDPPWNTFVDKKKAISYHHVMPNAHIGGPGIDPRCHPIPHSLTVSGFSFSTCKFSIGIIGVPYSSASDLNHTLVMNGFLFRNKTIHRKLVNPYPAPEAFQGKVWNNTTLTRQMAAVFKAFLFKPMKRIDPRSFEYSGVMVPAGFHSALYANLFRKVDVVDSYVVFLEHPSLRLARHFLIGSIESSWPFSENPAFSKVDQAKVPQLEQLALRLLEQKATCGYDELKQGDLVAQCEIEPIVDISMYSRFLTVWLEKMGNKIKVFKSCTNLKEMHDILPHLPDSPLINRFKIVDEAIPEKARRNLDMFFYEETVKVDCVLKKYGKPQIYNRCP